MKNWEDKRFQPTAQWYEIAKQLPSGDGYRNITEGMRLKFEYINDYLPELNAGGLRVLDIGAGCGFFCAACNFLSNTSLAVLHPREKHGAFRESCEYLGVDYAYSEFGTASNMFVKGGYDIVNGQGMLTMNATIHWHKILDEMLDLVTVGGYVLIKGNYYGLKYNNDVIVAWARGHKREIKLVRHPNVGVWKWQKLR